MKNIFKILIGTFVIGSLAFLYSCEDEDKGFYDGPELASFTNGTTASYFVQETGDTGFEIQVGFTTASNTIRTVNFTISGDATEGEQYSLSSTSITVPAGSTIGTITVNGIYAGFTGQTDTLTLTLTGDNTAEFDATYTLIMQRYCPFVPEDFVGSWNALDHHNGTEYTVNITHVEGDTLLIDAIWSHEGFGPQKVVMHHDDPTNFYIELLDQFVVDYGAPYGPVYIKEAGDSPFSVCDLTMEIHFDPYFTETSYFFGGHYFITQLTFNSSKAEQIDHKINDLRVFKEEYCKIEN